MGALQITKETFEQEVMQCKEPVLLDFWAAWCGPCQALLPVIEELAKEVKEVKIAKVNVDEQPELAERYQVMTIPTLLFMKNGQIAERSVGFKPKEEIERMLELLVKGDLGNV